MWTRFRCGLCVAGRTGLAVTRRAAEFIVQMNNALEWPGGGGALRGEGRRGATTQVGDQGLECARQIGQMHVHVGLHRGKT
jgi:hypothetical protein